MDGYQYEHHCAKLLKQRGFRDVTVTKSSGDQGIDVIAYNENVKYGIQCKYYSYPVGNQAVQQAYAGAKFYDCNIAVVGGTIHKSEIDSNNGVVGIII